MRLIKLLFLLLILPDILSGQYTDSVYWNTNTLLVPYRLFPAPIGHRPEYIDLDGDGKPDVLRTVTAGGIPVQWIDDNNDMEYGDLEGDTVDDCLMIDLNRDGIYGGYGDLIIDWVGADEDGNPPMQVVVFNVKEDEKMKSHGHYMWVIDNDGDGIFNYIDWREFVLRCWYHSGTSNFFEDYLGQSAFLKIHSTPERMNDVRLNWENPFLFFDPDNDGLTEMAIRMLDTPDHEVVGDQRNANLKGTVDWVSISIDMDNDNGPGNEFDFDMTLHFRGPGFDYMDQRHTNKNLRGRSDADHFFLDPRWRQLTELIYPGHDRAWKLIFERGIWDEVWFCYDEDDDCNRWERVEMYQPLDPFKVGAWKEGLDNNPQSDPSGDRGEWDLDNSGGGNLYIGGFDGKIHLYGAEWGAWRIDQASEYYQGMGKLYDGYGPHRMEREPKMFPTIRYTDTDGNGFFDRIEYDLDGDTIFEETVSLFELGLPDECELIRTAEMKYDDFVALQNRVSDQTWRNAEQALGVAEQLGLNTSWYALMKYPRSVREKYHHGFWLQFYLYKDLEDLFLRRNDPGRILRLKKAYYGNNWNSLLEDEN